MFTVNYHIWVIRTLLSHRKWWYRSTSYFLSSEQELKAWYKGFKRDCPRAQLTRQKVITLNSATSCSILSFGMKTDIKTDISREIRQTLQRHETDPMRCNKQTNKRQTQRQTKADRRRDLGRSAAQLSTDRTDRQIRSTYRRRELGRTLRTLRTDS